LGLQKPEHLLKNNDAENGGNDENPNETVDYSFAMKRQMMMQEPSEAEAADNTHRFVDSGLADALKSSS